jgi:sirohydrochlorin cobaltochelatase
MLGVIVFAHGSRDPLWRQPVESVAQQIARRDASALVSCAYLELSEPDIATAARQLVAQGATRVRVLPLFFGMGKHAREDLPHQLEALRQKWPAIDFSLARIVGEEPELVDLLARIAVK